MKKLILSLLGVAAISSISFAGTETYSGKEMKQVAAPPPCPEWYADREFNVGLWGTYVFTGNDWQDDRYMLTDHAWGGGLDLKYFFWRYIGVGIEGWAVDARQTHDDIFIDLTSGAFAFDRFHESHAVGSVLGTLTLRYPIPCTRFAPYIFGGGGGIFGGGQRDSLRFSTAANGDIILSTHQRDSEAEGIGQVGAGIEVRFTPHIGWISDFSWNFINGPDNNFGMVRTGVNFAF